MMQSKRPDTAIDANREGALGGFEPPESCGVGVNSYLVNFRLVGAAPP